MRILHTSDWHVGKAIRGHSRAGEHRGVLAEIVALAAERAVDVVLVAGDLFDSTAPSAESEQIVYQALLALSEVAPVVVIAGNHDNARRLRAVANLFELARVTIVTEPRRSDDGGVVRLNLDGTPVQVAAIPFISQRAIVRSEDLMARSAWENAQTYSARLSAVIKALSSGFDAESVNIILAHLYTMGAAAGGGERPAHLVEEYAVGSADFPPSATYVALGHLHRPQAIPAATAVHYCGAPLQLDFGEQAQPRSVNVVEAEPGLPAKIDTVALTSGRPLMTVRGTLAQLSTVAVDLRTHQVQPWLRVEVEDSSRPGLSDEVRELLGPGVVDVRVTSTQRPSEPQRTRRDGHSPSQLFAAYLDERDERDPGLRLLFDQLLDEVHDPDQHEAAT